MCTGSQGEPMAALGRIADGNHRDIHINEFDTVILASSLIPGNEHGVYKVIQQARAARRQGRQPRQRRRACPATATRGELLYVCTTSSSPSAPCRSTAKTAIWWPTPDRRQDRRGPAERGFGRRRRCGRPVPRQGRGRRLRADVVTCYVDGDSVGELTDDELEKRRILGTEGFVSAFVVVDTDNHEVVTARRST